MGELSLNGRFHQVTLGAAVNLFKVNVGEFFDVDVTLLAAESAVDRVVVGGFIDIKEPFSS